MVFVFMSVILRKQKLINNNYFFLIYYFVNKIKLFSITQKCFPKVTMYMVITRRSNLMLMNYPKRHFVISLAKKE
jgi:hypothetical protein